MVVGDVIGGDGESIGEGGATVQEEQKPPTAKQAPPAGAVVLEEQDPPVHDLQAEAATPKFFKPAWQCGTPGCNLINFHQGQHECQQVVGPRQRRQSVRAHAAAESSEDPAVPAKSVRKKRQEAPREEKTGAKKAAKKEATQFVCDLVTGPDGNTLFRCVHPGCERTYASTDAARKHYRLHHGPPSEEMDTHETLHKAELPTAVVARPVVSADVMPSPRDRLATNPDPRRTDFLVRFFVFGHT